MLAMAALLLIPASGFAQADDNDADLFNLGKSKLPAKPKFTATLTPSEAKPGDEVTLAISVTLPQGFYIYSTTGTFGGRTMIDTNLVGLEAVDAEFIPDHEPKTEFEPLLKEEVGKFFGTVTWSRKYRVQPDAKSASLSGELTGQYCGGLNAENPACILIDPPFAFKESIQVAGAEAQYTKQIQPMKLEKGVEKPAAIAYHAELTPTNAKPGEKVTLSVKATLNEGWHTFSGTMSDEVIGGKPTVIETPRLHGLKAVDTSFHTDQPFEKKEDEGNILEIYHHEVTWTRDFEVLPETPAGQYGAEVELSAQYCNERTCNPITENFALGLLDQAVVPPVVPANARGVEDKKALLPFILLCLGGGFLALLTPCSFPMVPITVSFFLKQSEAEHKRPWLLALIYCGSIVAAFTIMGVGISAFFGATKLNELANIPWLNIVIGTVFVLFALNMLGVFEIQIPGWLLTLTASQESAGSYLGAVFMALTFTLTSFTCTFAIAGSLLVGAAQGDVYWPVIGMLAFGTAFAAPFFVLAMLPGLLKKLPKSGGWMNSVKVVMSLLELGAAVKFFSIADPGQVLLDHTTVMMIWFVIAIVTAVYLFGGFRLPHDSVVSAIAPLRMLFGMAFFILAGLLLTGLTMPDRGGLAVRQILAFAPAHFETGNGPLGPSLKHHGLEFALYLDKALPVAQKENRPLLIDFTGVNCANCRDMENKMAAAEWKERIAKFVGVQLFVDTPKIPTVNDITEGKRLMEANKTLARELVKDTSMPAYAVVAPDGKTVLATYIGAEPANQTGTFVKFLDEGWERWEQLKANGGQAIGMNDNKQAVR